MRHKDHIPHLPIVVAISSFVLFGFAAVSAFVLIFTDDEVTKGNIIGTWQNFGMLAVGFWIGSSSGGKSKEEMPPRVQIDQPSEKPIPAEESHDR